ncbi:helix-turn-helix transcriptional regulator [Streptomyces sp. SID3343]|uniref:helix-turn-helix domain-containing protein n=1 Tax=Streptomyces sp. SID3343 TaxID=2690260 RepID=UPI0013696D30|nr:helix-turn-helix transcriptional regulator [Streptomyces sp. SID3343]MYW00602.1 helix-turn-helix domain-containing protein [Streptomyces sp. SID3343]
MPIDDTVGRRITDARTARHLTLQGLADAAKLSRSYVQKIESGDRPPSHQALVALARALRVDVTRLTGQPYDEDTRPEDRAIHAVIPDIRRVMLCYRTPESLLLPPRPFEELHSHVQLVNRHRRAADYATTAAALPALLTELTTYALSAPSGSAAARAGYSLLAQVYRAANSLAHKLGYYDLSASALERVAWAAGLSGDPIMVATSRYLLAGAMTREGAYTAARQVLREIENDLRDCDAPGADGMLGAALLKRSIAAAGAVKRSEMNECLDEAAEIGARIGHEGIYQETSFGPVQVEIYRASAAIMVDDFDVAVRDGGALVMPEDMPAERSSHHYIDYAHALVVTGDRPGAWAALRRARELAPLHTRKHPRVRDSVATLLRLERADDQTRLGFGRWVGVTPP